MVYQLGKWPDSEWGRDAINEHCALKPERCIIFQIGLLSLWSIILVFSTTDSLFGSLRELKYDPYRFLFHLPFAEFSL